MNEKEIAELRRRFRADKSSISRVRGCYVNEKREIISQFDQSLGLLGQTESEQLLSTLRKTLSGTLGKNLLDIPFDTRQVVEGDQHKLLMTLRNSALRDEEAVSAFYQRVIQSLDLEGNYLILLVQDDYDVPYRSKDDQRQDDASSEVFRYILCSICPVKQTKEALSYYVYENAFHSISADWVVSAPEMGFLFPSFDERSTNLYDALYYCKDTSQTHPDFVEAVFHAPAPMPAAEQMETFQALLEDTLSDECRYQVVQSVHGQLREMIEEHKANKVEEPLVVDKGTVRRVLEHSGVSEEHVEAFEERYDDAFGADADLSPRNLVDTKQLEITTPDVTIKVSPDRGDLVETRLIDGARYILIRAEEGVAVNGVPIQIS
ncbi:MAG: DUF4317 domain-containing protein [Dysosmobacter sp.]|uniref:DUF4317 domain-containing protein n=1 Tax=Dysosmobacter sp. TaxID=2591382 RepID=UPI00284E3022|nr:DUF4317 domain-containing protein [Dysosmobacter sp.]MDR3982597.1 DUF4317 domain-containing protein [Dysosmobacter sp.]